MSKTQTNKIVLSTNKLAIGYRRKKKLQDILKNINLTIEEGTLTAIIGKNGVGKSTLIRTLAKQQEKNSGNLFLNHKNAKSYSANEWAKEIAWVQTDIQIPVNLSVTEFVSLGRQPYTNWLDMLSRKDHKVITNAIELTDITLLKDKKCGELSDGQLQRVYIARALAQDTAIIFLDEPTTHLDIIYKAKTLGLLKQLCLEKGKTIVYTTHEIELSLQVANQFICVSNGNVISETPQYIIENNLLDRIFENDVVFFDKKSKRFKAF